MNFSLRKNNFIIYIAIIFFIVLSSLFFFKIGTVLANSDSLDKNSYSIFSDDSYYENEPCLYFFYKSSCSQCQQAIVFIEDLESENDFKIKKYNIEEEENKVIFNSFKSRYGLISGAYPSIFIGDNYLIGNKAILNNLEKELSSCEKDDCPCSVSTKSSITASVPQAKEITAEDSEVLKLPLVGQIDFSSMPMYVTTSIIAFVDGFNPCSLWLITFLISIVIYSRSRKKIIIVGGTFLIITGAVYALFMAGLLNVFSYVGYLNWIQIIVAVVATIFALVNIKDYFWYKKGISFTISDKYKPRLFKNMRGIIKKDRSIWQMVLGTSVLALGVVLIELPCTAGFPVVWTNILAQKGISGAPFYSLLALYMLIYLLDEVLVLVIAAWTMRISRFEEKHGRILKLIGGVVMLALALVMFIDPELMNDVVSTLVIFTGAIIVAFLTIYLHRYILPKFKIRIGSEKEIFDNNDHKEKGDK